MGVLARYHEYRHINLVGSAFEHGQIFHQSKASRLLDGLPHLQVCFTDD
jgi:hypothetical protein